jgi:hypothetical protein
MTENELRAFLRATPDRVYSTRELIAALPGFRANAAQRFPDLIARKEPFIPTKGFAKGKPSHHYFWQDNPAVALPVATRGNFLHRASDTEEDGGLPASTIEDITAAIRSDFAGRVDEISARVDRLERIARMIGHDL